MWEMRSGDLTSVLSEKFEKKRKDRIEEVRKGGREGRGWLLSSTRVTFLLFRG